MARSTKSRAKASTIWNFDKYSETFIAEIKPYKLVVFPDAVNVYYISNHKEAHRLVEDQLVKTALRLAIKAYRGIYHNLWWSERNCYTERYENLGNLVGDKKRFLGYIRVGLKPDKNPTF